MKTIYQQDAEKMPAIYLTPQELKNLPEYSCSIPTGVTIGKRWRKNIHAYVRPPDGIKLSPIWVICEYIDINDPKMVGISYHQVRLKGTRIKAI